MTSAPGLLRRAIPGPVKRALKATWSSWRLRQAWRALLAQAADQDLSAELIRRLTRAWDNEGFAAGGEVLALLAASVHASRSDIMECGCGLSTIVLGALTRGSGRRVCALEHLEEWARPVRRELSGLDFRHVDVIVAPLREFDTYWWYDVDPARLPPRIDLVFCDGPPGNTPSGRVGLLDRVGARLAPRARIVLDDAARDGEREIIGIWSRQFGVRSRASGSDSVALLELP